MARLLPAVWRVGLKRGHKRQGDRGFSKAHLAPSRPTFIEWAEQDELNQPRILTRATRASDTPLNRFR